MEYSTYISGNIYRLDEDIRKLNKELVESQERVKEIKLCIAQLNQKLIDLAKEKEDFINFQKGKKDGEEITDDRD